jgi:cysteine desulfurase
MVKNRIYFDYAATTPVDERVRLAMEPYYTEKFGNPSSLHAFGQETKAAIEQAREQVAGLIGALPEEIVFTSGGTEADNYALEGIAYAHEKAGNHIIVSAIEHHAVLACCDFLATRGFNITYLPVDKFGIVSPESVKQAITDRTILVSVMHANNEIGTIEPIAEIAKVVKGARGEGREERVLYFHTDAVQTVGHIPVDVNKLGVDLLAVSAHKLYGPKGVGLLYVRKGTKLTSLIHGGGQERSRRASTENVAGIVGFGVAAEIAAREMAAENKQLVRLRDDFVKKVLAKVPDSRLNGDPVKRLPNNLNFSINYIEGEAMLINLDVEGIAASTGSACSSGTLEPSHVLKAIGLSYELSHGSLRFSLGKQTTEAQVDRAVEVLDKVVKKLRAMSPLTKGGK